MGGYYARAEGLEPEVADAVRDHYKPGGPSDTVPTAPVTVAVALADKLDSIVCFFEAFETPTGSRDPYALRRAALGAIRQILNGKFRVSLRLYIAFAGGLNAANISSRAKLAFEKIPFGSVRPNIDSFEKTLSSLESISTSFKSVTSISPLRALDVWKAMNDVAWIEDVLKFFADRLKVLLRDEGKRHDLVDAVFALGDDDLVRITRRVEALSGFLATEDGATLLAGYKRAVNILKAEAKKGEDADLSLNPELSDNAPPEEAALIAALRVEAGCVDQALAAEDFTAAMRHLARLRAPVDAFFDKVLVNDPDPVVRLNRLRLLTQVRDTANRVADFSLISG